MPTHLTTIPFMRAALIMASACSSHALAETSAPVTSVVLYPGSATIERTSHIAAGVTQVEIKGLPSNFDVQTLRVEADAGIQIGQIVTQDAGRTDTGNTREAQLEAQIQALQDKQAELEVEAKSAALVQNYLGHLNGASSADAGRPQAMIDAKSMATVIDTIRRSATDSFERTQKVAVQTRELVKKIDALQRDLAKARSGNKDARSITVNLAARQAGDIRLSYQVNGAGWKPTYRATLDTARSSVDLERLATISQKTGEDWSGVRLRLSTGQPRLSPQALEPRPWLLTYNDPPTQQVLITGSAILPVSNRSAPMPSAYARAKEARDAYIAPVLETQNTFTTEFEVPARVTLPADGREISVALSRQLMPVRQRVRVTPRLDKTAVLTAEAERPSGVWLNGPMQLFRDGNYVGSTSWNAQATDGLLFSFGRDDLVRVTVDRAQQESGTAGILSQHAERKVSDLYTLTSLHKTPVDVLVLEASPVSTSDEIKVQASYSVPPGIANWEKHQGVVAWEKNFAPNETMKLNVSYSIAYPKEGKVNGLP
ncbi:mucoidy inhibitor MuiA family protein [Undibacterium sp. TJN25]|uniref:mucoidy inhibitor MuiA family protein n=1 Tax=Undibacterium sp. TJN25 TaxID=3413056 RepID=UPI003BF3D713